MRIPTIMRRFSSKLFESGGHTFARFFRHSVHALGVTTPKPLLRFEFWGWPVWSLDDADDDAAGVE